MARDQALPGLPGDGLGREGLGRQLAGQGGRAQRVDGRAHGGSGAAGAVLGA